MNDEYFKEHAARVRQIASFAIPSPRSGCWIWRKGMTVKAGAAENAPARRITVRQKQNRRWGLTSDGFSGCDQMLSSASCYCRCWLACRCSTYRKRAGWQPRDFILAILSSALGIVFTRGGKRNCRQGEHNG